MTGSAPGLAAALDELVRALDLAPSASDGFTGRSPAVGWRRIFGGLVIAQALVAMTRTAEGRPVHSLHGYFMLPGDPREPVAYAVERLRDGASFSTRHCVARQHGRAIFAMSASFHVAEPDALDHAEAMPEVPPPEALPSPADLGEALPRTVQAYLGRHPVEMRFADPDRFSRPGAGSHPPRQNVWMRAAGSLPDAPALHAALLAYMSDEMLLDTAAAAHGRSVFDADLQAASLDHALWFHRPVRADAWMLFCADSPSASGSRGFTRCSVFDRGGTLLASVAQEGLLRLRR